MLKSPNLKELISINFPLIDDYFFKIKMKYIMN